MEDLEVICDISNKNLTEVPAEVLKMHMLKMLYLDKNEIMVLPDIMFEALPNLTWLDLRDNLLETLPRTIGTHKCLETILLENNKITHLPKELCRLFSLKVLQLADNPLIYPPPEIVDQGLDDIIIFLQQELYKEEQALKMVATTSGTRSISCSDSSSVLVHNMDNRTESGTIKLEILPTVLENNLTQRVLRNRQQHLDDRCQRDKIHKVIKSASKTSIQSYYKHMNVKDYLPSKDKMTAEQIKQEWLEKLKELISDQERILQQEKAMGALKNWRKEQNSTTKKRSAATMATTKSSAPFATNPAYNSYMTRADPSAEVKKALQDQVQVVPKPDVDLLIKDIMTQLKRARDNIVNETNPDEKLKKSENELNVIMAMHKKVSELQRNKFL